ncbi:MAG: protein kinase, partial [bacterium]|nr:protein kinase [bacterium]
MMKCTNCGAENPDDAGYCKECGTAFNVENKTVILDNSTKYMGDPLSFSPGEKFGDRYQIIEEIGEGGMGKVFKARDNELNIVTALKMIKPQLSANPDIVSRFKRELLLAREILHEHVIRIHDLGEIAGIKYISMNYIEGNSLQEIIQSTGKLTIEKTIDITKQVCGALTAAHEKGIVHRDLKPQNIMIDKRGKGYVLDFGIARSIDGKLDAGATQEGIVLGTPHYMSPEQIKGDKVDAGTDIYSLG